MITGAIAEVTPRRSNPIHWDTQGECTWLTASLARSSTLPLTLSTCSDVLSLCPARFPGAESPRLKTQHRALAISARCTSDFILFFLLTQCCGMTCVLVQEMSAGDCIPMRSIWKINPLIIRAPLSSPSSPVSPRTPESASQKRKKACLKEYFLININPSNALLEREFLGRIHVRMLHVPSLSLSAKMFVCKLGVLWG